MIKKITLHISNIMFLFVTYTSIAHAKDYVPLSKEFAVITDGANDINKLLNGLLEVSVGVAAILAVIMLSIGGFKYMTTESIFQMGNAKEQITNAIVGLLIVLAAVLIMTTINPNIVKLDLFN